MLSPSLHLNLKSPHKRAWLCVSSCSSWTKRGKKNQLSSVFAPHKSQVPNPSTVSNHPRSPLCLSSSSPSLIPETHPRCSPSRFSRHFAAHYVRVARANYYGGGQTNHLGWLFIYCFGFFSQSDAWTFCPALFFRAEENRNCLIHLMMISWWQNCHVQGYWS